MVENAHPERFCAQRHLRSDPSHADQAEGRTCEIAAEQLGPRPAVTPAPLADEPVRLDEVPAACEHQRKREVGDGRVEDAWSVRDRDTALAAGRDVHRVVADPVVGQEAEVWEQIELLFAHPHDDRNEHLDAR